jgi:pimeloyl-ACP methyl ester carboxylesterase
LHRSLILLVIPILTLGSALSVQAQTKTMKYVLPEPTGTQPIGRTTFYWKDRARPEPSKHDSQAVRELRVDVWYPAEPGTTAAKAAYCADYAAIKSRLGIEGAVLGNIATHTLVDPPLAKSDTRYAVLLLSPGHGNNATYYMALVEELVSHGYIVATVDHPLQSAAVAYPDGRVVGVNNDLQGVLGDPKKMFEQYRDRVAVRAADLRFVLDQLTRLNAGEEESRFRGRLDLDRVGVVGHSIGGIAAGTACIEDARFKAAINLDGHVRSLPILLDANGAGPRQPFMELTDAKSPQPPSDEQLAQWKISRSQFEKVQEESTQRANDAMRAIAGGSFRVAVAGANHQSFGDSVLWIAANPKPHQQRAQIIRDYARAFFDKFLRGDAQTILDAAASPYAEATVERFSAKR